LLMPFLLNRGVGFWMSLVLAAGLTIVCFAAAAYGLRRVGIELMP
jgi:hypothetical protein